MPPLIQELIDRPGLTEFLDTLKTRYEMHVYTMGTRAYALEVCKAIDPDQTVFGERVLTRDESGSKRVHSTFYFLS